MLLPAHGSSISSNTSNKEDLYQLAFIFDQLGLQSHYERIVSQLVDSCVFDHSVEPSDPACAPVSHVSPWTEAVRVSGILLPTP